MNENLSPESTKIIIDHRGTEKVVPINRDLLNQEFKVIQEKENPLEELTAGLVNKLETLTTEYSSGEDPDEETGLRYLSYIKNVLIGFTSHLEKTGKLSDFDWKSLEEELNQKIETVSLYSRGRNPIYLENLRALQLLLKKISQNQFEKGMFSFVESSLNQIMRTISQREAHLNQIIQERIIDTDSAEVFEDDGESDPSTIGTAENEPMTLDKLLKM